MDYTVCFLIHSNRQRVLMVRKGKTAFKGRLNGIGGVIECGETPEQGASREVREEAGFHIDPSRFIQLAVICLPDDCAKANDPAEGCRLFFYTAQLTEEEVSEFERDGIHYNDSGEELLWRNIDLIRHASPMDPLYAGNGDVPYMVNLAAKALGL